MYHAHFGLATTPFCSQPTAGHYVPTPGHDEALARLDFLADTATAGGLLLGPAGIGKTLLLQVFARGLRRRGVAVACVSPLHSEPAELLSSLATQWGASVSSALPAARAWRVALDRLAELRYEQVPAALLLDDADEASDAALQTIGQLVGGSLQPLLLTTVLAASSSAFSAAGKRLWERSDLRIELPRWEEEDVRQYVDQRLTRSGGRAALFNEGAIAALCEAAEGIPRRVSQLAQLALVAAAGKDLRRIDAETVEEVCQELSIGAV